MCGETRAQMAMSILLDLNLVLSTPGKPTALGRRPAKYNPVEDESHGDLSPTFIIGTKTLGGPWRRWWALHRKFASVHWAYQTYENPYFSTRTRENQLLYHESPIPQQDL